MSEPRDDGKAAPMPKRVFLPPDVPAWTIARVPRRTATDEPAQSAEGEPEHASLSPNGRSVA